MKRIALVLAIVMLFSLAACGAKEPEITGDKGDVVGGYTINTIAGELPEAAAAAFEAAETEYTPLALIGQQLVAGTNYFILVNDNGELKVVKIYSSLEGKVELIDTFDFDLSKYYSQELNVAKVGHEDGAAIAPSDVGAGLTAMPQALATATSAAFADFDTLSLTPLAQVATQVVAGTNYALVCQGKTSEDDQGYIYMVILYSGVDGTNSVVGVTPIDVSTLQ